MGKRVMTSWGRLWAAVIIAAVVNTGCGGFTVLFGGGFPYGGYYYDDFYYNYGGRSYYDGYWYYDDYWYDDYYFVDYIDDWYDGGYYGCYFCKPRDGLDADPPEEPADWDARWGPWEMFVRARVDYLRANSVKATSSSRVPDE